MLDCLNFRTLVTTNAPINVNRMGGWGMQLGIKAGDLTRAFIPSIGNLNINVILRVGHLADITPCDIIMHINRACKILKKVVVLGAGNTHNLVAQGHFSLAHIKLDKYKRMKLNEPQQNRCLFNC